MINLSETDEHVLGDSGFYERASELEKSLGKFAPKQTIRDSTSIQAQAHEFWTTQVKDYDTCLQYYTKFHPEYPEPLEKAAAMYMTLLVEKQIETTVQTDQWDYLKEIDEIKSEFKKL